MISIPTVATLGAHALDLLGPDHHHIALLGGVGVDDGGAPPIVLATSSLVHVVLPLEPAGSRGGTDTLLFIGFFYGE